MDLMTAVGDQVDDSGVEDKLKAMKRKISLSNCGVCGSEEARYKCPACLKHSCSLSCVKKHKKEEGCSGVRNKTAFISLPDFDEMGLLSDYRFLEDTGRMADSATRDSVVRAPRVNFKAKKLAAGATQMNITLRFLPMTFTKSRENSTICIMKEKRFLWHLKLIFPQSETEFSERRVPDSKTLEEILTPYIHPTESDPVRRQRLKMYVHTPFDHVKVFMKAEGRRANSTRYHEMDLGKSLKDNLSYKMLIEYPVLHIVLKGHFHDYPVKGQVETTSACSGPATKGTWPDANQGSNGTPAQPGTDVHGGPNIRGESHRECPETEPPKEKRARREPADEVEEGEITDSSDEEEEGEKKEQEESEGNVNVGHKSGDDDDDDDEQAESLADE